MQSIASLSDNDLLTRAQMLAKNERAQLATLLEHLIEIDRRRLYERWRTSLFCYLMHELRYSESSAGRRAAAARLCARVPQVLEVIRVGDLHLCGANRLAGVITADNANEVLKEAAGKSMSQIDQIVVRYAPKRIVSDGATRQAGREAKPIFQSDTTANEETQPVAKTRKGKGDLQPATPDVFNIRFAAKRRFVEKLERAQELLSNSSDGSYEDVLERALDAYLAKNDPLLRETKAPPKRSKPAPVKSRYIPKSVRTAVIKRDQARCTHVDATTGRRCEARRHLQVDHIIPFARGGSSRDPANLRLLCSTHNLSAARATFGAAWIAAKITPNGGSRLPARSDARLDRMHTE